MKYKLELKDVSYVYGAKTPFEAHALNNINLAIEEGSVTGIIGHTGSGKSTLLRLISGVYSADVGAVTVDGNPVFDSQPVDGYKFDSALRLFLFEDELKYSFSLSADRGAYTVTAADTYLDRWDRIIIGKIALRFHILDSF